MRGRFGVEKVEEVEEARVEARVEAGVEVSARSTPQKK